MTILLGAARSLAYTSDEVVSGRRTVRAAPRRSRAARCPVHVHVNVCRLDIQVNQFMDVNFSQAVEQIGEEAAHKRFGELVAID